MSDYAGAFSTVTRTNLLTGQPYQVTVFESLPNRPPMFTSTPVSAAHVNTTYTYQADTFRIASINTVSTGTPPPPPPPPPTPGYGVIFYGSGGYGS